MGDPAVFISAKSEDYPQARRVYEFLAGQGISCFYSDESLLEMGEADYKDAIDQALDGAQHLVVVTSSRAHADSKWVKYEWNTFANELLSGRKTGNILTVLCGSLTPGELPIALRQRQCLDLETELEKLPRFLRGPRHGRDESPTPLPTPIPPPPVLEKKETPPIVKKDEGLPKPEPAPAPPKPAEPRKLPGKWWIGQWLLIGALSGLIQAWVHGLRSDPFSEDGVFFGSGIAIFVIYLFGAWFILRRYFKLAGLWFAWMTPLYALVAMTQAAMSMLGWENPTSSFWPLLLYGAVGGIVSGLGHAMVLLRRQLPGWRVFGWAWAAQVTVAFFTALAFLDGRPDRGVLLLMLIIAGMLSLGLFAWGLRREMQRAGIGLRE